MTMSKRRKKATETKATKPAEEAKVEKKVSHPVSHKKKSTDSACCFGQPKTTFYGLLVVVAAVFFTAGFLTGPGTTASTVSADSDQFIFISPPGCSNCDEMEPLSTEVADTLGLPFVKAGFAQEIENPGFVLIHDGVLTISGVADEYTFKAQVCSLTENKDICDEVEDLTPPTQEPPPVPDVPKSDKPEVHAFVMSYCPYGLQFMKAYVPVLELLGDKEEMEINFVQYLMHGVKESDENTRMYCIQKEQKDKLTDYLRCFVEAGDHDGCIDSVGIDSDALDSCIAAADEEFAITATIETSEDTYPAYNIDLELTTTYGVRGSPSFGINGQPVSVSRSAESIKQAVCAAFNNPPEECTQTLSSSPEAAGLGPIGSGSAASGTDAQC